MMLKSIRTAMSPKPGIIINNANGPGFWKYSNTFHIQMMKKIVNASVKTPPMKGTIIPTKNSIGHQGIFAILLAISAGPTRGIQAIPGDATLVFFAKFMKTIELQTYRAIAITKATSKNPNIRGISLSTIPPPSMLPLKLSA